MKTRSPEEFLALDSAMRTRVLQQGTFLSNIGIYIKYIHEYQRGLAEAEREARNKCLL